MLNIDFTYNRKNKLNKRGANKGKSLVQLRVNIGGHSIYDGTGIYLAPDEWDDRKKEVKNHRNKIILNRLLREKKEQLEDFALEETRFGRRVSLSTVRKFLDGGNSFLEYMRSERKLLRPDTGGKKGKTFLAVNSLAKHDKVISYFEDFVKETLDWKLGNFDHHALREFDDFLSSRISFKTKQPLKRSTVGTYIEFFKHYTNRAFMEGLLPVNPFERYSNDRGESEGRDPLTFENVKTLIGYIPEKEADRQTLDWFCYLCFIGVRDDDASNLKIKDFKKTSNGLRMKFLPKKTQRHGITIDINVSDLFYGLPEQLILPYLEQGKKYDSVFPLLPNDNKARNVIIKRICKDCGIKLHVSIHSSRHTSKELLSNRFNVPDYLINKIQGRSQAGSAAKYGTKQGIIQDGIMKQYFT